MRSQELFGGSWQWGDPRCGEIQHESLFPRSSPPPSRQALKIINCISVVNNASI